MSGFFFNTTYSNTGTGNTLVDVRGFRNLGTLGASWTATDWSYAYMEPPAGAGTITRLGFAEITDLAAFAGTLTNAPYSIWSKGITVQMQHAGPAIFGSTATTPIGVVDVYGDITIQPSPGAGQVAVL